MCQSPALNVSVELLQDIRPVDRARNTAVMKARAANVDWLVQIDNDNGLPQGNGLLDVIQQCGPAQDVVGLSYGMKNEQGLQWCAHFLENTVTDKPFIEVDRIGAGVLLIRNTVWKRLPAGPWFVTHYKNDGELGPRISAGEDVSFCKECRAAGLGVWASVYTSLHLHTTDLTAAVIERHKQLQQH
jgi:hypothetical protein